MMAHGIVAVSVITALMPRMAAAAADGRHGDVADQLSQGTRLAAVILVPAAALYIVLGQPLAVTLFNWGQYNHDSRRRDRLGDHRGRAGPGAVRHHDAADLRLLRDARHPDAGAGSTCRSWPCGSLLDVLFYLVLPASVVTASLMLGTAASFVLALVFGYWLLRRKIGRLGLTSVADTLVRLTGAAGSPVVGVRRRLADRKGDRRRQDRQHGRTHRRRPRAGRGVRGVASALRACARSASSPV